jgi:hypothetical protein
MSGRSAAREIAGIASGVSAPIETLEAAPRRNRRRVRIGVPRCTLAMPPPDLAIVAAVSVILLTRRRQFCDAIVNHAHEGRAR